MYGDNYAIRGYGSDTYASASYAHGTLAMAGSDNISAASAKMITNSTCRGLLEESAASPANALIGRDFNSIDFRTMPLPDGAWFGGIRNGMEAFAAVGDNRAYKNGDDVWVMSSGTGRAGVNGNQVWASNEWFEVTARLCACTDDQRGKDCYCACHRGPGETSLRCWIW